MLEKVNGIQILEHTPAKVERKVPAWVHLAVLILMAVELVAFVTCSLVVESFDMTWVVVCFILCGATLLAVDFTSATDIPEEYRIAVSPECSALDWTEIEKAYHPRFIEDAGRLSIFRMIKKGPGEP